MSKKVLSLLCVFLLVGCRTGSTEPEQKGLVEGGEAFNKAKLENVSEQVKDNKINSVHGVKISGNVEMSLSYIIEGQKVNSVSKSSVVETYNFETKTLDCSEKIDGTSYTFKITVANDKFVFSGTDEAKAEAEKRYTFTLAGFSELLDLSAKSFFSWNYIPSSDDIKSMQESTTKMLDSLGFGFRFEFNIDEVVEQMTNDFVMAGDFDNGNFEVGFDKEHTYNMYMDMYMEDTKISTSSITLKYSKMHATYKDYLLRDSYSVLEEIVAMRMNKGTPYESKMSYSIGIKSTSTNSYF